LVLFHWLALTPLLVELGPSEAARAPSSSQWYLRGVS
jgi:hypothetical protein